MFIGNSCHDCIYNQLEMKNVDKNILSAWIICTFLKSKLSPKYFKVLMDSSVFSPRKIPIFFFFNDGVYLKNLTMPFASASIDVQFDNTTSFK